MLLVAWFIHFDLPTMMMSLVLGVLGLAYYTGGGLLGSCTGLDGDHVLCHCHHFLGNTTCTDLDFSCERIAGLLLGIIVIWLINNFFFPINPNKSIARKNGYLLRRHLEAIRHLSD